MTASSVELNIKAYYCFAPFCRGECPPGKGCGHRKGNPTWIELEKLCPKRAKYMRLRNNAKQN